MATAKIGEIEAECGECGSKEILRADGDDQNSPISCGNCGADLGSLGDFQESAKKVAKDALPDIEKALKKALGL